MIQKRTIKLSYLPTGPLPFTMLNDYMARAVLQKNRRTLKRLVAALLSISPDNIRSLVILNSIELGKSIKDKDCILDLKLCLNDDTIINIELQILNLGNWPERSLTYLCRAFDQTQSGGDYIDILPTIHIGILDFNLPHLTPEFYSEFKMMNTKNHEVYSDKFILRVLNLKAIEDKSIIRGPIDLYDWALLFKARTWEELKMLAEKDECFEDTVVTFHEMTADEKIREQCEAREKYNWDMAAAIHKGRTEGHAEGKKEGLAEGEQKLSKLTSLINRLHKERLFDDISKVTTDTDYREELYKKYGI